MKLEKKKINTAFTSILGLLLLGAALVLLNLLLAPTNLRIDCTEKKNHTLSAGTLDILENLPQTITLRFYCSKGLAQMPTALKNHGEKIKDLLLEYQRNSHGKIKVQTINPTPDSDEEEAAAMDGITPQTINSMTGESCYLGLAIACGGKTDSIPFLDPEQANMLEYEVSRAITAILQTQKKKLPFISPLRLTGGAPSAQAMTDGQGKTLPPWFFVRELRKSYDISVLSPNSEKIPDDINLLVVVHPIVLTPQTLFAIDQFILRGGRLLALLDPLCLVFEQNQQKKQYTPVCCSTLPMLLQAWGISFSDKQVVMDRTLAFRSPGANGRNDIIPTILNLQQKQLCHDDPVTANLNEIFLPCPGAFSGAPTAGLEKTVLLYSSSDCSFIDNNMAQSPSRDLLRLFKSQDAPQELAIKLTGTFHTAFPNGLDGDKTPDSAPAGNPPQFLVSNQDGMVILVADADFPYDPFCIQTSTGADPNQITVKLINDNLNFLLNAIDSLGGDTRLFQVRARAIDNRPFQRFLDLQLDAENRLQAEIEKLEQKLTEARENGLKLQRLPQDEQKELLSAEQREMLRQYRQVETETKKELKKVRKQLRQDIDNLKTTIVLLNLFAVPALVILAGLTIAACRKKTPEL